MQIVMITVVLIIYIFSMKYQGKVLSTNKYNKAKFPHILTGFSLAEVLITLLIVSIVASITIPALLQDTNNGEIVVRLKKFQSDLNQCFMHLKIDYGGDITSVFSSGKSANVLNIFATKLNFQKNCGLGTGCWASYTYFLNGGAWSTPSTSSQTAKAILNDGTLIAVELWGNDCTHNHGSPPLDTTCGDVFFDVNGFKGPNKLGKDIFAFYITPKGIFPRGMQGDSYPADCKMNSSGYSCTAKVISQNSIDY